MTDIRDRLGGDAEVTRVLRELYAAPAGGAYWDGLEASIMRRLSGDAPATRGPLDLLAGWSRVGLVAAGLSAILAGAAAMRDHEVENREAVQAVLIDSSPVLAIQTSPGSGTARDATLRYLITP